MIDILALGVCSVDDLLYVDVYPPANGKSRVQHAERQCGGLSANALVAAARLGAHCAFAGQLGSDELSQTVIDNFRLRGIDLTHLKHDPAAKPVHSTIVISDGGKSRAIFPYRPGNYGAPDDWPAPDVIRSARVLFVDHMGARGQARAARIAREVGVPVVSDLERDESPYFGELNGLIDHAIFSHEFATHLTHQPDAAQAVQMLAQGRAVTIVTVGEQGCFVVDGAAPNTVQHVPAFTVDVVDTTGCGDCFHSGYAYGLALGLPLIQRIRLASATAALKATQRGGQAGCPTMAQVQMFLAQQA